MTSSVALRLNGCRGGGHHGQQGESILHELGAVDRPGASCAPVPDERRVQAVFAGRVAWRSVRAVTGHVHALHWRDRSSRRGWTDPARAPSDTSRLDAVGRSGPVYRYGGRNDLYLDLCRPIDGVVPRGCRGSLRVRRVRPPAECAARQPDASHTSARGYVAFGRRGPALGREVAP